MPANEPSLISEITEFGRIDAESELQLADFFVRTDAYMRIEDQQHIVVVGRKGTGKTAIYRALLQRSARFNNTHAVGLQFRNYPWQAHAEVEDTRVARVERYTESWQFLILVELAKLVLLSPRFMPRTDQAQRARQGISRFITANWGTVQFDFKDTFAQRAYSVKLEPKFAGTSIGSVQVETVDRKHLAGFLVEANRWLKECLNAMIHTNHYFFILFDDLDRGYDPLDDEYADRLIGLLLAAREVFNWSDDLGLLVGPIVLLRSDIYEHLSFPDKNKITENLVETLHWTDDMEGENSLKMLIDRRIRAIGQLPTRLSDPWPLVFDDQLMRGTQHKFKHMAARTYLRPRDMIKFANCCLNEARAGQATRIDNRHIVAARNEYSSYLLSELDDEMSEAVPNWNKLCGVLRRGHKLRVSKDEFVKAYRALKVEQQTGIHPDAALESLFRFSVVGFTKTGGAGYGGSAVAFQYRDPRISFDPSARMLHIHPGLKEGLDLIEASDR